MKVREGWSKAKDLRCPRAVNMVLVTSRFVHEANRTRNYLLPCIDLSLLILNQYLTIAQKWSSVYQNYERLVTAHCHHGYHGKCKDVCYEPSLRGGRSPKKRLKGASTVVASSGARIRVESLEVADMIRYLMKMGVGFEKALKDPHLPTYPREGPISGTGVNRRFQRLYDDAQSKCDNTGVFTRVGHSIRNTYTRTTPAEKAFAVLKQVLDLAAAGGGVATSLTVGQVARPLMNIFGNEITVGQAAKGGITGGITLVEKLGTIGCNAGSFSIGTADAIKSDFIQDRKYTADELKASGAKVESLFKKATNHFTKANGAMKKLEQAHGGKVSIVSCDSAMGMAQQMYEFMHHFDKMGGYVWTCLGLIAYIGENLILWTKLEAELWVSVESLSKAVIAGDHGGCLSDGTVCYGPKKSRHRHFFSSSTYTSKPETPHKPL